MAPQKRSHITYYVESAQRLVPTHNVNRDDVGFEIHH